jgi:threonine/homoserine efflux transporter RhtA
LLVVAVELAESVELLPQMVEMVALDANGLRDFSTLLVVAEVLGMLVVQVMVAQAEEEEETKLTAVAQLL